VGFKPRISAAPPLPLIFPLAALRAATFSPMLDVGKVLKDEISRLARKEAKQVAEPLMKRTQELRNTLRAQRQEIAALRKELARKQDKITKSLIVAGSVKNGQEPKVRIRSESFISHRKRFRLSQREMALLLGVSPLTISHWELGKSSPRDQNRSAFAELRNMSAREVKERL